MGSDGQAIDGGVQHARLVFRLHAVRGEQCALMAALSVLGDVGQNDILIRRQAEFDVRKFFRDFAQRDFLRVLSPRPVSTNRPRNHFPSTALRQPSRSAVVVNR